MNNPFKHIKHWKHHIFLAAVCLELIKTLLVPNPIDVLILIGLIVVFIGLYSDDFC